MRLPLKIFFSENLLTPKSRINRSDGGVKNTETEIKKENVQYKHMKNSNQIDE